MRLGCCGSIDDATKIQAAGFDFLEVNVQAVLKGDEPGSVWDASAPRFEALPLPIEAANSLVPGHRPIVGPQRDLVGLQDYMQRVAKRAQIVGIRRLVFGSGGARKRPEGVDAATADEHLAEFTRMAGEVCAHHEVLLVIEHLNQKETNTLNRLAQARSLCERVNVPGVRILVDSYHYGLEHETDDAVLALGDRLRHVHIAEPVNRLQPGAHGEVGLSDSPATRSPHAFDFVHFFCLLKKIGYDERISFEGRWKGSIEEAGPGCVSYVKKCWAAASAAIEA